MDTDDKPDDKIPIYPPRKLGYTSGVKVSNMLVNQFAGMRATHVEVLRDVGVIVDFMDYGATPEKRRVAMLADPCKLYGLVEAGFSVKAIQLGLGFVSTSSFRAWLRHNQMLDAWDEHYRYAADTFNELAVSSFDILVPVEDSIATLSESLRDTEAKSGDGANVNNIKTAIVAQTTALNALLKVASKRYDVLRDQAAVRNPSKYGSGADRASQDVKPQNVTFNMNFGTTPVSGARVVNAVPVPAVSSSPDTRSDTNDAVFNLDFSGRAGHDEQFDGH